MYVVNLHKQFSTKIFVKIKFESLNILIILVTEIFMHKIIFPMVHFQRITVRQSAHFGSFDTNFLFNTLPI